MIAKLERLVFEDRGQGLLEYSLILFFIAIATVLVLQALGYSVYDLYNYAVEEWPK